MTDHNAGGGRQGSSPSLVVHLKLWLHNLPDLSGTFLRVCVSINLIFYSD